MINSHRLNAQRERWSENLPTRPGPPVRYADGRDDPSAASGSSAACMARPFNLQETRPSQNPRPVCRDFVKGVCLRKSCWFKHPIEHSPLYKNIEGQKAACQAIQQLSSQRLSTITEDGRSQSWADAAGSSKTVPVEVALYDLEAMREKQKVVDIFNSCSGIDEDLEQLPSLKPISGVEREALNDYSGESEDASELDDHYKVFSLGPRQRRQLTLSRPGIAIRTMREKRSAHRGFDYQAFKEFMKPVREFTWCSFCKSKYPNCGRCSLRKKMGLPPEEAPPAEVIIRENAEFYKKLFSIEDKPKSAVKKPRKTSEAHKRSQVFDRNSWRYPPGTKRPDWDVDVEPENEVIHTSWNPADYPSDGAQWDALFGPPDTSPGDKTSSGGNKPSILAPTRPTTPPRTPSKTHFVTHQVTTPQNISILASTRPTEIGEVGSQSSGSPKPFVLGERPEEPSGGTLSPSDQSVCFNCWRPGHLSRRCKSKRIIGVLKQEQLRVQMNAPLSPTWLGILQRSGLSPIEPATDSSTSETPSPTSLYHRPTTRRQRIRRGDANTLADEASIEDKENGLTIHSHHSTPSEKPLETTNSNTPVVDPVQTVADTDIDSPRVRIPLKPGLAFARNGRTVKVVSVSVNERALSNRQKISRATSSLSSWNWDYFKPENARYWPVTSGSVSGVVTEIPPVLRLPNEITSQIFKILFNDRLRSVFPYGNRDSVYNEETILHTKNIILDAVRKTNTVWRSLAQAELYQNVAISSMRSLDQFARSVKEDNYLALLVKKVKIDIPFIAVDGWTPSDAIATFDEEKAVANRSARSLNTIITYCCNLNLLVAKCAGAFRVLFLLKQDHLSLEEVTLSDDFARRSDIKGLWDATKRFPNMKAFELEAPARCLVEKRARKDPVVMVESTGSRLRLKSISLVNFPYVSNNVLQAIVARSARLENLEIEGCRRISSQGLSQAIRAPNAPRLKSLTYKAWRSYSGEPHDIELRTSEKPELHLCSTISEKLGQHLVHLQLSPYRVCEQLVHGVTWEALKTFTIRGLQFRACEHVHDEDERVTEEEFQQAVEDADMPRLEQEPSVVFGYPRYGIMI
ncbi:hypothetical protein TWF696_005180 [Orbilia brochopaga]|uniref:CCHC-type domain-containing protein n=1 Tax=Orbilia brochopaga TaxID=3140254 RepID=A0AAV9V314_9PEZI